jgi:S-adenosylmethionine synthetase
MIRTSEAVLRGHPDKFCDQIADRILYHAYEQDPAAYGQIEVAAWSDQVFLTGATVTRQPLETVFADVVRTVGQETGYTPGNSIDANRYQVHDHICRQVRDPREWTRHINDQAIIIGWAGYDAATRFLSPEHFLVHTLREALDAACSHGQALEGHGPDGKVIVHIEETPVQRGKPAVWRIATVLVTLQQKPSLPFMDFQRAASAVVLETLRTLADRDRRWRFDPAATRLLINPNGPFFDGGSNSDNGQTGRKLVMDYYGPRIPLGGGALSGKDLAHIDRAGAYAARRACIAAVENGAKEAMVRLTYAPGISAPLDVTWSFSEGGRPPANVDFRFESLLETGHGHWRSLRDSGRGSHFSDPALPWNLSGNADVELFTRVPPARATEVPLAAGTA